MGRICRFFMTIQRSSDVRGKLSWGAHVRFAMAKTTPEAGALPKLPKFGLDRGQYAVLVLGRRFDVDLTLAQVKKAHALTERHRKSSGLPLVFVSPGTVECEPDDMASERFFAGLYVMHAQDGKKPIRLEAGHFSTEALATIPAAYFTELEALLSAAAKGEDEEDDEDADEDESDDEHEDADEDEGPSEGLFLAPANWATASIFVGSVDDDAPVLTTSSEDTSIGAYLSPELRERLAKEKKKIFLQGSYC